MTSARRTRQKALISSNTKTTNRGISAIALIIVIVYDANHYQLTSEFRIRARSYFIRWIRLPDKIRSDIPALADRDRARSCGRGRHRGRCRSPVRAEGFAADGHHVIVHANRSLDKAEAVVTAIQAAGGVALITADHGNADEMFELDKKTKQPAQNKDGSYKAKTAHTLNPVPLILYDNVSGGKLGLQQTESAGLSNIAATVANLLGYEKHAKWDESLLEIK